jgi:LPS-assembly protein
MLFFSTLLTTAGRAESLTDRLTGSPTAPWQISADKVDYDAQFATYHASGNVIIEKEATRLIADRVSFNQKTMTAAAAGHVMLTVGDDMLSGDRLDLNLEAQTGVLHQGTVFLKKNHFYISGERIEKTGKNTYQARRASVTSCDGEQPDWIITGRTLNVTIEGYGRVTHAVLKARNMPVLYTPYLLFPAKTRRQSGLLIPEVGISDRKGFAWDQPLFWAIDDSSDATLFAHYMQKRGTKIGLEYRYVLANTSYGALMADGLQDRQIDDGTPENTFKWGYAGDPYDRPNTDRYWARAKIDQQLPGQAMARLDLDVVSDQDYLVEFREGRSGFDETRNYFLETFGRDLDPNDESTRTNRLNVNRTWAKYSLNANLLWEDNVTNRRWEETDDTLQRLPVIEFDAAKQAALGSGLFWDLDSEYVHFFRQDGDRGHRIDLYPRAYLPLSWKNYLSVEPSAGWRQTVWEMTRREDESLDRSDYRQIVDARLDLSSEFSKVMGSPIAAVDRIRHSVRPRAIYQYIPKQDQSDLPFFTELDRIDARNAITYSLTNTFTARGTRKSSVSQADDNRPVDKQSQVPKRLTTDILTKPTSTYHRFCRFYLEQTYDVNAARENQPEPFSDIFGELDLSFGRYFGFDSDARFDVYDNRFLSHNIASTIADRRGDRLRVEHSYEKDVQESINSMLSIKLTDHLTVRGVYERNLLTETDIRKGAGFLYTAQCWSVDFFYAKEGLDNKFSFFINLTGIGGFGQ